MKRQEVEMVDGRVYYSDDNWTTVYLRTPGGTSRRVTGKEADLARLFNAYANPTYADGPQPKKKPK